MDKKYNFLNLPQTIEFGYINTDNSITYFGKLEFVYDAFGTKMRKTSTILEPNGQPKNTSWAVQVTDYMGEYEYTNKILSRIHNTEGAAVRQGDGSFVYEYSLKDHLGNTRVTFSDANGDGTINPNNEVSQINHYYPFGLNMEGNWNGQNGANKVQYNGKEWNDDFGLGWNDYGARFYDPAMARWGTIDPMAEKYVRQSSYNYVGNNPIKRIDPNGMVWADPNSEAIAKDVEKNVQQKLSGLGSALASKEARLDKLNSKIAGSKSKFLNFFRKMEVNSIGKEVGAIKESASALRKTSSDLSAMGDKENKTNFKFQDSKGLIGYTHQEINGLVVMEITNRTSNAVHEATHGGQLDRKEKADGYSNEVAAYKAQFAMDPSSMPSSIGGVVGKMNDINELYIGGIFTPRPDGTKDFTYKGKGITDQQQEEMINKIKNGKHE